MKSVLGWLQSELNGLEDIQGQIKFSSRQSMWARIVMRLSWWKWFVFAHHQTMPMTSYNWKAKSGWGTFPDCSSGSSSWSKECQNKKIQILYANLYALLSIVVLVVEIWKKCAVEEGFKHLKVSCRLLIVFINHVSGGCQFNAAILFIFQIGPATWLRVRWHKGSATRYKPQV